LLSIAHQIVTTGTFNDSNTSYYSLAAPGYPFFLALAQWVGSPWHLSLVICLQMLLDYCVALVLLFLGSRETSIEVGWLASALFLVFPPAVVISTWITAETLFTALFVLSIAIWIRALFQSGSARLSFVAGLTLGLATLVRATTQFLPLFFLLIACFKGIPKCLLKCALFLIGMYVLVLPWTLRNIYVLHEPILVQTGFGWPFLQGSRSEYFTIAGKSKNYPILYGEAAAEGLTAPDDRKATSDDRWHFNLGLRAYRIRLSQEPWSFFPFFLHKFARLWYGMEEGIFYRQLILGICSLLAVPAGLFQIWLWKRTHPHLSLIFGLLFLYFIGLHLISLPEVRYVLPLYPFLIFSASHQYVRFLSFGRCKLEKLLLYPRLFRDKDRVFFAQMNEPSSKLPQSKS